MSRFKDLQKNLFGGTTSNARQFGMIATLVAIVLLFQIWTGGLTLTSGNLIAVVSQYAYILILAIGMVMVIIAGHIDLSVGSVAAFVGIVVATAMSAMKMPFLPRSDSTWLSQEVNLFSVGLMFPPTACDSVGVGVVGFDIAVPLLLPRVSGGVPWS